MVSVYTHTLEEARCSRGLVVDDVLGVNLVAVVNNELAVLLCPTRRNDRVVCSTTASGLERGSPFVPIVRAGVGVECVTRQHATVPVRATVCTCVCVCVCVQPSESASWV